MTPLQAYLSVSFWEIPTCQPVSGTTLEAKPETRRQGDQAQAQPQDSRVEGEWGVAGGPEVQSALTAVVPCRAGPSSAWGLDAGRWELTPASQGRGLGGALTCQPRVCRPWAVLSGSLQVLATKGIRDLPWV